jgi:DNA-binding XRE family transcriptional regulator
MRIAGLNSIQNQQGLTASIGLSPDGLRRISDYPLLSFGEIAARTACTDLQIVGTTFFHMGKKFGRSTHPASFASLLIGSLASSLRYCPSCLIEELYYSLVWRFSLLSGCTIHGCRLLDCCGHCGETIPLFAIPFKIGVCPACRRDLRSCRTELLSEQEMQMVRSRTIDLAYLLSPHSCEEDDDTSKKIGYRFALLRRAKHLLTREVAANIDVPMHELMSVEQGGIYQFASLQVHLKYADYLGVALRDIFQCCVRNHGDMMTPNSQTRQLVLQQHEDVVCEHVQEVVQTIITLQGKASLAAVVRHMHILPKVLKQYASVNAIWNQVLADTYNKQKRQNQQRDNDLFEPTFRSLGQHFYE